MKKSGCQLELRDPAHWGRQMEWLGKQKAAYIMEDRPFLGNQEKAGNGNHTIIIADYVDKCKEKVVVFWSGSRWKSMPA